MSFGGIFLWKMSESFLSESIFSVLIDANVVTGVIFLNYITSSVVAWVAVLAEDITGILVF